MSKIIVNLDVMLAKKMSLTELSENVAIKISNLSILKKVKQKRQGFRHLNLSVKF